MNTPVTRSRLCQALLGLMLLSTAPLQAANFVYEGQLDDRGVPANGRYDVKLAVYRDAELGATLAAPMVFNAVDVVAGRFRLDFDVKLDDGQAAWVELAVRDAGAGGFSAIPGRTKAMQAPAAIGACWSTVGDSGSNPATHFLGTTDAQPLVLRTRNVQSLRIEPSAELFGGNPITANVIAGSSANSVTAGVRGATISGGGLPSGASDPVFNGEAPNRVTDAYGTVGGGYGNRAGDDSGTAVDRYFATVAGGVLNSADGVASAIGGGQLNEAHGEDSTVGGGFSNLASGVTSAVGGGASNTAGDDGATVSGGYQNTASGYRSAVGGGSLNTASGSHTNISGGLENTAGGVNSTVGGGQRNLAAGFGSTVGGGDNNCAGGDYSWAGGRLAKIRPGTDPGGFGICSGLTYPGGGGDQGTFVWADSQNSGFVSTGSNQFLVRATGGMALNGPPINVATELSVVADNDGPDYANLFLRQRGFNAGVMVSVGEATSSAANDAAFYIDQFNGGLARRLTLEGDGDLVVSAQAFKPGGGAWSASSDARLKTTVEPLTGALDRLLALRGTTFEYRADVTPKSMYLPGQQIGFVAQEVELVFPQWVGETADGFKTVGPQGFEALTVEALRELRNEGTLIDAAQADEIHSLKVRNKALEDEAAKLRASDQAIRRELAELRTLIETRRTGER